MTPDEPIKQQIYALLNRGEQARHDLAGQLQRDLAKVTRDPNYRSALVKACEERQITPDTLGEITPALADTLAAKIEKIEKSCGITPSAHSDDLYLIGDAHIARHPQMLEDAGLDARWKDSFIEQVTAAEQHKLPEGNSLAEYCRTVAAQYDDTVARAPKVLAEYESAYKVLQTERTALLNVTTIHNPQGPLAKLLEASQQHEGWYDKIRGMCVDDPNCERYAPLIIEKMDTESLPPALQPLAETYLAEMRKLVNVTQQIEHAWDKVTTSLHISKQCCPLLETKGHLTPIIEHRHIIHQSVDKIVAEEMRKAAPDARAIVSVAEQAAAAPTVKKEAADAASIVEKAGAEIKTAASKTSGRAKWILGAVAAATVTLGAALALTWKKSHAERVQERRQNNTAPQLG